MNTKNSINTIILLIMMIISQLASTENLIVTKSFTGSWYDPAKSGQGFLLEIINTNNQKKALTTWFTFDTMGNQFWLIGVGDVIDNTISFEMLMPEGGRFGDLHDSNNVINSVWGNVVIAFNDCNNGTVNWTPLVTGFNSGSMPINRLTQINNLNCTGGLFDEIGDNILDSEIITPLVSSGLIAEASGKTKYEQRSDRIEYSVEIEDLPIGTYQLLVDGQIKGDIDVVALTAGSTEGEIEFRDPVEAGKILLDFDPVGKEIKITQNQQVYLSSNGSTSIDSGNTSSEAPPFGNSEIELYMTNIGVYAFAKAKAKLEQRTDRVDFKVELENIPTGFYNFNVDGNVQGVIEVIQTPAGVEGELEFRNPVEAGKELLDFNPLGAQLTITENEIVLFNLDFPASPSNDNDDECDLNPNDDDCDDGSNDDECDSNPNDDDCDDGSNDDECDSNPNDDDCDDGSNDDECDLNPNDDSCNSNQDIEIEVDFINSGLNPDASGSVEYEIDGNRRDFKVEIEDIDIGNYDLIVGGVFIMSFDVNSDEVELEFRDPVEPGKILLDFDPLNQLIEIKQQQNVYLSVLLQ
jgi:hypothetical protein